MATGSSCAATGLGFAYGLRSWMTTLRYTRAVGAENQKNAHDLIAMIGKEKG